MFRKSSVSTLFCLLLVGLVWQVSSSSSPLARAQGRPGANAEAKKEDKDKKQDDAKKDEAPEVKTIKRPTEPAEPANAEELNVEPDESGRLQFSFRGQPWADVLQWFADTAGYSLDWQELPEGFLNLTTQRKYTLAETRDLLNRHLLARGFTMLVDGDTLTVVNVSQLDPSLVPRAEADDLEDYAPYEFMRVTFPLPPTMAPDKAKDDVKTLLSPNAKVTPLLASKRLLVIDAVANLRAVRDLFYAEQSALVQADQPREFHLKHRRAEFVADQVMIVLGLDPSSRKTPQELQLETKKLDLMIQMQQKNKDISKLLKKDGPPVYIAVNVRLNSILVNAPPELMPIIERTIKRFDVPEEFGTDSEHSLSMKKYHLVKATPSEVIMALEDIVNLGPRSRLQGDPTSKTILATATQADHEKIRMVIEKLDVAVLPTVEEDALDEMEPHDFARVRFQLPIGMNPADSAQDIQPLVGETATVLPLLASRRLLVVDTVENLREVRDALRAEEAALKTLKKPREYTIKHRRAEEVISQVLTLLGVTPNTLSNPQGTWFNMQNMKLFVSVNHQRNSLQISAQPELLAMVEQAIEQFDVPDDGEAIPGAEQQTLQLYPLVDQDVSTMIRMLNENVSLAPLTRLQTGPVSEILYATATPEDHEKIRQFIDKIAPKPIESVEPDALEEYPAHEKVRVRFQLPITADMTTAAAQIQGLLGTGVTVQPLESSKQMVVVDKVANLLEVREVLQAEAAALAAQKNIREFPLKHRRAEEMVEQVLTMLGLDPKSIINPQELRRELQTLEVFISANAQRNSLGVNAPPDKMKLVEQIIKQLDVPVSDKATVDADRLLMVPYRIAGQDDVTAVIKVLESLGSLSPLARLEGDPISRTLYVYGSQQDHEKVRQFVDKLDPNLVPHLEADELEEHPEYVVARVLFQLPLTADVDKAATQIRGMLGTSAKVQSLASSKQLVVVDTVANLLEVRGVLQAEATALAAEERIREFPLKHRRAEEMVDQVLTMLGFDPESIANPQELRRELQALEVFVSANVQRNSLIVNAPLEKMQLVEQIVEQIDVPEAASASAETDRLTMVPYNVGTEDASIVAKNLKQIGNLSPHTRLQGDLKGKILYAFASKADHHKIRTFIDKLDPAVVPSAEADELEDLPAYDVVRVRFQLPLSADAGKAAEQIKGILGFGARVQALNTSKQLVVVDTVSNLIDVRGVLYAEQLAAELHELPRVFPLRHRRASYVADQVMVLLGLDPESRKSSSEVEFESRRSRISGSMQPGSRDNSKPSETDVHIAVNRRENSLLINAPFEKMPMIERAIEQIDVPGEEGLTYASGPMTMKTYRTDTASTEAVIRALEDIGNLDPKTQLDSDPKNKAIFAHATPSDHVKIRQMIDRLDGDGRQAKVIPLRRLAADQVAGTLMSLLVGEEKKENDDRSRRRYYFYGYGRSEDEEKKDVGFKAFADVENNRLLVWANDAELEEVYKLLEQLGEIPSEVNRNPSKVRVLSSRDPASATQLLRQLEQAWSGKNRLNIHTPEEDSPPQSEPKEKVPVTPATKKDTLTEYPAQRSAAPPNRVWLAQFVGSKAAPSDESSEDATGKKTTGSEAKPPTKDTSADSAPPIDIFVTKDGRIVIRGDDPVALDELEDLLSELAPPQEEFHVFQLRNASAYWVVDYLEQYFEEELKGQMEHQYTMWGEYAGSKEKDTGPTSLSKRRLLRFIYDVDTNTIVVQNASASQLRTIEQLIKIYDRPMSEDAVSTRRTEAIKIKYSRAADIATSLKEVFRDLLSSKDKEFQGKDKNEKSKNETYYRFYGSAPPDNKKDKKPAAVQIAFEGALSVGVDEISNSIIISVQEEVWENVRELVMQLDEAAKPKTIVQVHEVSKAISAGTLKQALANALGEPWPGNKPPKGASTKGGSGGAAKEKDEDAKNEGDKE